MQRATFHIAPPCRVGDERVYHRICKSLYAAGFNVALVAQGDPSLSPQPGLEFRSLGKWSLGAKGWSWSDRWHRCREAYRLALEARADIYAFYALEFLPWAAALRRKTNKPVIFDCMEDFESWTLQRPGTPKSLRRPLSWAVGAAMRRLSGKIDAMVFSDTGTARRFAGYARRAVVAHNFPVLQLFPRPEPRRQEPSFDITFHGGFHRHILAGCLDVDDALVARNRRLQWRLIGHMPLKEWFTSELRKRGSETRFSFLGLVSHDQVAAEVSKAKIGFIPLPNWPKYQNNIPQKLFEFMALEMPVVLSDLPPSRPFVGDKRCVRMVTPDDPNAFADAVIQLVDDATLRRKMGIEGRRRVEAEYNWDHEAKKLVQLYEQLLQ